MIRTRILIKLLEKEECNIIKWEETEKFLCLTVFDLNPVQCSLLRREKFVFVCIETHMTDNGKQAVYLELMKQPSRLAWEWLHKNESGGD